MSSDNRPAQPPKAAPQRYSLLSQSRLLDVTPAVFRKCSLRELLDLDRIKSPHPHLHLLAIHVLALFLAHHITHSCLGKVHVLVLCGNRPGCVQLDALFP